MGPREKPCYSGGVSDEKKDLTGLLDLPQEQLPPVGESVEDPHSLNTLQKALEQPSIPSIAEEVSVEPPSIFQPEPEPEPEPELEPQPIPTRPVPEREAPEHVLDRVKDYSERVSVGQPAVAASYPFSLLIEGALTPQEQEKLIDLINRENMGIREMDLEPQFAESRVLIPRISEYAGVLIVQALRAARARMRLGPSDTIFASQETSSADDPVVNPAPLTRLDFSAEETPSAESLPISADVVGEGASPGAFVAIDVVTASAALRTSSVEAVKSVEYQELLEALTRELKYKAYRKGANAIVNFSVQLTPLSLPTHYRVTVMGSAVRQSR
jgi:uncharacterized protein YbjQ (UPF0145 family)